MAPRPRQTGNKDLPANLYLKKVKGKVYFQYKHPLTGKFIGVGTNKKEAVKAAIQANQELVRNKSDILKKIIIPENSFKDYLIEYRDSVIPGKRINGFPLSEKTITENKRLIKHIISELGHLELKEVTQKNLSEYLHQQSSAETFNKHRAMLCMIFKHAVSDGLVNENIAEKILKRDKERVKRQRLSLDEYKSIYAQARPAIQNAMELSLNSLQRRADIQFWRFDNEKDNYYHIIQSKTRKHGKSAYLRIPVDLPAVHSESGLKTLGQIVNNCRDRIVCPFVIHEKRKRRVKSKEKKHMLQLSLKQISDGFAEARDKTGLFNNIDHPPSFHELLSLGEHLREKQGWTVQQIQILRGHSSEKMTRHYLDGHEWTTVEING